jgi:hypothetical protein
MTRYVLLVLPLVGCPAEEPVEKDTGDTDTDTDTDSDSDTDTDTDADTDTDGDDLDASGLWTGSCARNITGYTQYLSVSMDLQDNAGAITGTFDSVTYYGTTTIPPEDGAQLLVEGTRAGNQVDLTLVPPETTMSSAGVTLDLTLAGDTLNGPVIQYGQATYNCTLIR